MLCVGHDGSYRLDQLKRMTIEGRVAGIVAYSAPSASRFLAAEQQASAGLTNGGDSAVGVDMILLESFTLQRCQTHGEAGR